MNIVELSDPDAVRKAVVEFDELGRVDFLSKYGFGVSRRFVLEIEQEASNSTGFSFRQNTWSATSCNKSCCRGPTQT